MEMCKQQTTKLQHLTDALVEVEKQTLLLLSNNQRGITTIIATVANLIS